MSVNGSGTQTTMGGAYSLQELAIAGGQVGALGGSRTGADGYVWMGSDYDQPQRLIVGSTYGPSSGGATAKTVYPVDVATGAMWFDLDDEEYMTWSSEVSKSLGWDVQKDPNRLKSEYTNAVLGAAAYQKDTGRDISPLQYIQMQNERRARLGLLPDKKGSGSGYSRVVSLSNAGDARVLVDNALTEYLGRAATEEESSAFLKLLNSQERANPTISTPGSQTGGVNREQVAKEFGRSRKDAAEFMADTQYMDWFMNKIVQDPTEGIASGL